MNRYFITGTDTDCGKTYVTKKLVDFFVNSAAIKPVASGGSIINEQFLSYDAHYLLQNSPLTPEKINPWAFKLPIAPHIAAKEEGCVLSMHALAEYCLNTSFGSIDTLFIEGAGGLMVPLNDEETWVDFLTQTQIPVLLVVGMRLGCINHALLTEQVLKMNNIECVGWIANCLDPAMLALAENISTLERLMSAPLLAKLSFNGEFRDTHPNFFM